MSNGLGIEDHLIRRSAEALIESLHVVAFTGYEISAHADSTPIPPDPILRKPDGRPEWPDLDEFLAHPQKVWHWYNARKKLLHQACPTPAHNALAELENLLENFFLVTQNTDALHQKAGTTKLVEMDGSVWLARCVNADYQFWDNEQVLDDEPKCPVCGSWLRPGVVWPGEPLPEEEFSIAREACELADLLLVIGTSGETQPAASLLWQAKATDATIIEINSHATTASHLADLRIPTVPEKALPALVATLKQLLMPHTG